jgi:two-component system chemotaxis response regulator CheY
MPKMDGLNALQVVMETSSSAQVVMVNMLGRESVVMQALQLGAKNLVVKPFQSDQTK